MKSSSCKRSQAAPGAEQSRGCSLPAWSILPAPVCRDEPQLSRAQQTRGQPQLHRNCSCSAPNSVHKVKPAPRQLLKPPLLFVRQSRCGWVKPPVWALRCDHQASPCGWPHQTQLREHLQLQGEDTSLSPATTCGFLSAH